MKTESDHIGIIKRNELRIKQLLTMSLCVSIAFIIAIGFSEIFGFMEKIILLIAGIIWFSLSILIQYYSDKLFKELPI
jgi:hypothetical protein